MNVTENIFMATRSQLHGQFTFIRNQASSADNDQGNGLKKKTVYCIDGLNYQYQ